MVPPPKTPGFNLPTAAHGSRAKLASLTWPRPSADECSLDDLSSSALGHSFPVVLPHLMRHLLSPPASCRWKSASAFHVRKKRSVSACSARGQITAFGLYCPLSGQAFAVAFFRRPSLPIRRAMRKQASLFSYPSRRGRRLRLSAVQEAQSCSSCEWNFSCCS